MLHQLPPNPSEIDRNRYALRAYRNQHIARSLRTLCQFAHDGHGIKESLRIADELDAEAGRVVR